jgi:hypothetical protein
MALTEQEKAALSHKRGTLAAGIADPSARRTFVAAQGEVDRRGGNDIEYTNLMKNTDREEENQAVSSVLGSRKHGGPIRKTGLYLLHAGEHVAPKGKWRKAAEKKANESR